MLTCSVHVFLNVQLKLNTVDATYTVDKESKRLNLQSHSLKKWKYNYKSEILCRRIIHKKNTTVLKTQVFLKDNIR